MFIIATTANTIDRSFMEVVKEAIESSMRLEMERLFEKNKKQLLEDFDLVKEEVVARAAIRIGESMSVKDLGNTLTIQIVK